MSEKTQREFEIEQAADTLTRAKEIKEDKKLHTDALNLIRKKQKIQQLVIKDV